MGSAVFVSFAVIKNGSSFIPLFVDIFTEPYAILPILYLSIVASIGAFLCLNYATNYLEVSKVTSYTNIQPVISLFAGVVFLSEPLSYIHFIACAMILVGVYMVTKKD